MPGAPEINLQKILEDAGPYPLEAYEFLRSGLAHTVQHTHGNEDDVRDDDQRHVTGQQLCMGLRDFAVGQFGLLAGVVLERWNVHRTEDFGKMVFALVDAGLMRKSETDTLTDFQGVYDFAEAFPGPRSIGLGPTPHASDN
ncbi:MAG: Minf_1886 family protein [Planctomycetota bacterium]